MDLVNARLATSILLLIVPLLLILLLFSFRDSWRAFIELYNPAVLRRTLRTSIPRFSLRALLIASAILPPCLAFLARLLQWAYLDGAWFFTLAFGYLIFMTTMLLFYGAADLFGVRPRKRWEKYLRATKPGRK